MTEAEWGAATNPYHMLLHVRRTGPGLRSPAGRRKFRLFGCASVRRPWDALSDEKLRTLIELAEQFADGAIEAHRLTQARAESRTRFNHFPRELWSVFYSLTADVTWGAARAWQYTCKPALTPLRGNKPAAEKAHLAHITRCIFGNPFRPVPFAPSWRTSDAIALARGAYADRAFDRLPILADALQDAGCNDEDILNHCRDTKTSHARGCWVVDHVLGFS
ncbi:hypothetical protein [Frigoriglobus tundricola]|uniref:Uncharacterized protein n=1 Tax=Frigoriglobus tundricola TaxID=2774151 RepID=A0A6M5YKF3_9BACT|nr:hypothetical protein [Frigoriglobus tundricola]QJW94507.1 hypothetical protein FTUN_2028 [Frigoriglobus tundricola]